MLARRVVSGGVLEILRRTVAVGDRKKTDAEPPESPVLVVPDPAPVVKAPAYPSFLKVETLPTDAPTFIENTPKAIDEHLKSIHPLRRSALERELYRGKWAHWVGTVREIIEEHNSYRVYAESAECGSFFLRFAEAQRSLVEALSIGDNTIEAEGQIVKVQHGPELVKVRLLPAAVPPARNTEPERGQSDYPAFLRVDALPVGEPVYLKETLSEIQNTLKRIHPLSQADAAKASYVGRWLKGEGQITQVSEDLAGLLVRVRPRSAKDGFLRFFRVVLVFAAEDRDRLVALYEDDWIEYDGQVHQASDIHVALVRSRFTKLPPPPPESPNAEASPPISSEDPVAVSREGLFLAGQTFDAYKHLDSVLGNARASVTIVDGYVGAELLDLLADKASGVAVRVLTRDPAAKFLAAGRAFNGQHGGLAVRASSAFHDRFVVVDNADFYHFGASLKDLGRRGFMFSKIEEPVIIATLRDAIEKAWAAAKDLGV